MTAIKNLYSLIRSHPTIPTKADSIRVPLLPSSPRLTKPKAPPVSDPRLLTEDTSCNWDWEILKSSSKIWSVGPQSPSSEERSWNPAGDDQPSTTPKVMAPKEAAREDEVGQSNLIGYWEKNINLIENDRMLDHRYQN